MMVQQSRQRLATFRNTVTYLMIILQSRLQKKEIEPEAAAEVISVIMEECVKFDTADLAHLLFRASLRFSKYGVVTSPQTLQLLLDGYKNSDAVPLMLQLAKEVQTSPSGRPLAMAAFLFAGKVEEAEAIKTAIGAEGNPFTRNDFVALVQGYAKLQNTAKVRDVVVEASGVLTDRSDVTAIVEQTLAVLSQQTHVADIAAVATVGIAKGVGHYSDAAIGAIARAMLRVTSTVEGTL